MENKNNLKCSYCGRIDVCKGSYPEGCFLENQILEQNKNNEEFFGIPSGKNDWEIGAKIFTRKEVSHLLYTQRAMISNDLKRNFGNDINKSIYEILDNPRVPKF